MTSIRPATTDDLPAITEIYNALIDTTTYEWTEARHTVEERTRWMGDQRSAGHPVLVAVDRDEVVGWATYDDFRDTGRWPGYRFTVEHTIHVAEREWGRGAGRELMAALVDHARLAGKRVMVAGVDGTNVGSIRFHARLGFREVGRLDGVGDKWGQRLDLVLLQHDLDQPRR
ncbi:GNAT family N-acetyltransferase [soil metagenome]